MNGRMAENVRRHIEDLIKAGLANVAITSETAAWLGGLYDDLYGKLVDVRLLNLRAKDAPLHENSAYWKGRLEPMEVVTVWLAIDPSTPANGCMQIIPRTHHNGFSQYQNVSDPESAVFSAEIKAYEFESSKAMDCVLEPGQCFLHGGRLIHGSAANTGTMRRCGFTMRYILTTSRFIANGLHQIYLAHGKDRAGNTYGDPTKPHKAWLDAYPDDQPAGH